MNDLSNDGTGLRERLYAESENYGLHEDVRRLLREAHDELALSAVAPPPVLEVAIKALPRFRSAPIRGYEAYEGQMIIEAHDGHMIQRDRVLELIAASPAAPAQPEGGDAVLTTAELAAVVAARANADHDDDGSDDDDALDARMLVDALDKLLKFTRPAPAQQAWQPIESAPKDGTRVLLGWDDDGSEAVAGNWNADKYATKPRPYWTNDREHLFGKVHTRLNPPTHWQALPPPPTGE